MPVICQNELERRLGLRTVNDRELSFVLSSVIPQAQYTSETQIDYPSAQAPLFSLVYSKEGYLSAIVPGEELTLGLVEQIEYEVTSKLLAPPQTMVCRIPLFAHVPTEGYWRYKDKLVICRAPDAAPRPFSLMAPHSVILEVSFSGANDGFIRNIRAMGEPRQFALFLSLLTPGLNIPRMYSQKSWAVEVTSPPSLAAHSILV